jgi:hypothetical protein
MRVHTAGRAAVSTGGLLEKPFAKRQRAATAVSDAQETGPVWSPIKALGGIGLVAILLTSAWLEWEFVKWVYSLIVGSR